MLHQSFLADIQQGAHYRGKTGNFVKKNPCREKSGNLEKWEKSGNFTKTCQGIFSYIYILIVPHFPGWEYNIIYICQSRDCNLVESQILLVETPIGVSTSRVSDWDFYW